MSLNVPRVLCHPDGRKSCGACCGMYNHQESSRDATARRLERRRDVFARDASLHDAASLVAFRTAHEPEPAGRLMPELPTCPFLGKLDGGCVGCLVHPLQNDGADGRDAGVYDRHICEDYLCAAHDVLRTAEKWLVIAAVDDSYTYGLVITDPLFVRQLFERVADLNGAYPTDGAIQRPRAVDAARDYFALKADWPWRALDGVFGQVSAGEGLETPRRTGPSEKLGLQPDASEPILRCLGTEIASNVELEDARRAVWARLQRFAEAVA